MPLWSLFVMQARNAPTHRPHACEFRLGYGVPGLTHITSHRCLHPPSLLQAVAQGVTHGQTGHRVSPRVCGVTLLQCNTLYSGRCILYKRRDIPFPLSTNYVKLPRGKTRCRSRLAGDSLPQTVLVHESPTRERAGKCLVRVSGQNTCYDQ